MALVYHKLKKKSYDKILILTRTVAECPLIVGTVRNNMLSWSRIWIANEWLAKKCTELQVENKDRNVVLWMKSK